MKGNGSMTGPQRWVLALTSVASLMVALDMLVVITAIDTIRRDLGATIDQLEWTITAYTLSFAVLLMSAAALGDRIGRRRMFRYGLVLFTAASAACALAPGIGWLVAARAVQGAGAAAVMPLAMALLGAAIPPERRAKALGVFSSVTGLAVLGGPLVGGVVVQGMAWEWIFWINVPVGLAVIALSGRLADSRGAARRLDPPGLVLVTCGALGLVWGLLRGNAAGWGSAEVAVPLVAGAALLVAFVLAELRTPEPMLPMRLFRSRGFAAGNAAGFLLYGSLIGVVFFLTQFLQVVMHHGPLQAGLRLAPFTGTLFVVAPISGAWINRIGERPLIVGGLFAQAVGFVWMALLFGPDMSYGELVTPMVLAGVGVSASMPAAQHAVIGSVPRAAMGAASGTFNTLRQLGAAFGIAVAAVLFGQFGGYLSAQSFSDGLAAAAWVGVAMSLLGCVAGLCLPGRARSGASLPTPARANVAA